MRKIGQQLLRAAAVSLGVLLVANVLFLIATRRANLNIGLFATLFAGLGLVIYGLLLNRIWAWRWLHMLIAAAAALVIGLSTFLYVYGNTNTTQFDEDAVIVLGASLHGNRISNSLARRLQVAVDYYQRNPTALIVVSGGQGAQEAATEASLMAHFLEDHGVPATQIIEEDRSTSTEENFRFSGQLLDKEFPNGFTAAFITNDFHVYRAHSIASRLGVADRHISAGITWYLIPVTYAGIYCNGAAFNPVRVPPILG